MANRRMFALSVIDTDDFQSMPLSTQAIYFHLALHADDDGFVGSPKRLLRGLGGGEDEMRLLVAKRYIIPFDSGICVIRHWRVHNYIQKDRYTPTIYAAEKQLLIAGESKVYNESQGVYPECIQPVSSLDTQLGKVRLGKGSLGELSLEVDEVTPRVSAREDDHDDDLVAYVTSNLYTPTPGNWAALREIMSDGMSAEMVRLAVDAANAQNARTLSYVMTILNRWLTAGIRTPDDVKVAEAKRQAKRGADAQPTPPPRRAEEHSYD